MLQVQIVHFLVRKYYFEKAFPHYTEVLMLKKQLYGISGWEARLLGCKLIREQKIAKLTWLGCEVKVIMAALPKTLKPCRN